MMPGAGLYLPGMLSRSLDYVEARTEKPRFFGRRSSQESDMERKSSEDVTRVFSSLKTTFDFADWASKEGKVSSDSEIFVSNLQRVRRDVTEASRLYTSQAVTDYLDSWPDKKQWIDDIIRDIEKALNDIGLSIEAVRVSGDDGGTVGLRRKFQWALSHQKKLMSKQQHLMLCHQSLMSAVQLMQTAEMNATFDPIYELPVPARSYSEDSSRELLKSPHSRQKWRMSHRNSSVPSITISEPAGDDDKILQPYLYALAELPGSTPEELDRYDGDQLEFQRPRSHSLSNTPPPFAQQDPTPRSPSRETESRDPGQRPSTANTGSTPRTGIVVHRRSLDDARPSIPVLDDKARASFDMARPRAYSDQVRPKRSFEVRNRSSHDQVRPMPTLTERPIERLNSTASVAVGDAVPVPLSRMRYRSRPVNVRKPQVKHHSLPSKLPQFPSQTSLMDDLSTWVIPQSARESYRSIQSIQSTDDSIAASTPATSVTSLPTAPSSPTTHPPIVIDAGTVLAPSTPDITYTEQDTATSSPVSLSTILPLPYQAAPPPLPSRPAPPPPIPPKLPLESPPKPRPNIPTNQPPQEHPEEVPSPIIQVLHRSGTTPIPPPLSRRRRPVPAPKAPTPAPEPPAVAQDPSEQSLTAAPEPPAVAQDLTESSPAAAPDSPPAVQHPAEPPSSTAAPDPPESHSGDALTSTETQAHEPATPAPAPPAAPVATEAPAAQPPHRNALHHLTSSASATDKYPIAFSARTAPPLPDTPSPYLPPGHMSKVSSLSVQALPSAAASVETLASESGMPARPMTAVAKRRAAHARRMELAFGGVGS